MLCRIDSRSIGPLASGEAAGYARISTTDQDLDGQLQRLSEEGCSIIRAEKVSGGSREGRLEVNTILQFLRPADELVDTRLDGLGRDTRDVLNIIHECEQHGAFVTVKQGFGYAVNRATQAAYEKRRTQILNFVKNQIPADIIAFQEVSGKQAVLDVLPGGDAEWAVCSFTNFNVQRLAIAYEKSLGTELACTPEAALSLKDVRPPRSSLDQD